MMYYVFNYYRVYYMCVREVRVGAYKIGGKGTKKIGYKCGIIGAI